MILIKTWKDHISKSETLSWHCYTSHENLSPKCFQQSSKSTEIGTTVYNAINPDNTSEKIKFKIVCSITRWKNILELYSASTRYSHESEKKMTGNSTSDFGSKICIFKDGENAQWSSVKAYKNDTLAKLIIVNDLIYTLNSKSIIVSYAIKPATGKCQKFSGRKPFESSISKSDIDFELGNQLKHLKSRNGQRLYAYGYSICWYRSRLPDICSRNCEISFLQKSHTCILIRFLLKSRKSWKSKSYRHYKSSIVCSRTTDKLRWAYTWITWWRKWSFQSLKIIIQKWSLGNVSLGCQSNDMDWNLNWWNNYC